MSQPLPPTRPGPYAWRWFARLSLRAKSLLVAMAVQVLLMVVLGMGIQLLVQRGFDQVEDQYLRDHVARLKQVIDRSAQGLERSAHDYAVWEDSYRFVASPGPRYIADNFNADVLANLQLTHILVFDNDHELVAGRSLDSRTGNLQETDSRFARQVAPMTEALARSGKLSSSGILGLDDGIYLVGACRILPTKPGPPPAGTFVHMRKVEGRQIEDFSRQLRVGLFISTDVQDLPPAGPASWYFIREAAPERLRIAIPVESVTGRPAAVVDIVLPRTIQQQARHFILLAWIALFATLATSALLWPLAIRWLVLGRLEQIHRFMTMLGRKRTLTERLPAKDGDELDALAVSINQTLDTLETAQGQRDASEHRSQRLQDQLTQVQKLEALATMAGGIAHDFNNSLSAIMGSIELMQEELPPGHPSHKHLARMQKAGTGACALARQMLNLSRGNPAQKVPIHLGDAVSDVLRLARAGLPKNLEIHFRNDALDDVLLADVTQIQQVVMNLATNASHAMAGQPDGRIEVTLGGVNLPDLDAPAETVTLPPGAYLRLAFSDNGPGIPREIQDKIFDPFFTTKPVGSGTGLGLAVAQRFVAQLGGSMGVQSEAGGGTTFNIHLPSYHTPSLPPHLASVGPLKILLVDDDPHARETLAEGLRKAGHAVTEAPGGVSALQILEEEAGAFAAVVTDQIMPGMSGVDLGAEIAKRFPGMPVFLVSGYTGPIEEQVLAELGILRLFPKPVVVAELDRTIRESRLRLRRKDADLA